MDDTIVINRACPVCCPGTKAAREHMEELEARAQSAALELGQRKDMMVSMEEQRRAAESSVKRLTVENDRLREELVRLREAKARYRDIVEKRSAIIEAQRDNAEVQLGMIRDLFNKYARVDQESNPGWIGNFLGELRNCLSDIKATDASTEAVRLRAVRAVLNGRRDSIESSPDTEFVRGFATAMGMIREALDTPVMAEEDFYPQFSFSVDRGEVEGEDAFLEWATKDRSDEFDAEFVLPDGTRRKMKMRMGPAKEDR